METRANFFGTRKRAQTRGRETAFAAVYADDEEPEFEQLKTSSFLGTYALPIIMLYLAAGTTFFAYSEEWAWMDAAYFSVVTLTTVGFGDLSPSNDSSKLFAIGYIICGLSIVATCLGMVSGAMQGTIDALTMKHGQAVGVTSRARRYVMQVARSIVLILVTVTIGATFVYFNEGWTMVDSAYWAVVTASTVGYGDLTIEQESTRDFCVFYILLAVSVFAMSLSTFGSIIIDIEAEKNVDEWVARGVSLAMLNSMKVDSNRDGSIDKFEFLQYMLVHLGKVSQEDLEKVLGMFDALDEDGSGHLDEEDVRMYIRKKRALAAGASIADVEATKSRPVAPAVDTPAAAPLALGNLFGALQKPLLGGK